MLFSFLLKNFPSCYLIQMILIKTFKYHLLAVVGLVVGKSKIFLKERSYPFYAVRFFSNLNYSLSVLIWFR